MLSIFLRRFSFQHEDFDRIWHIKDVQNRDKCHSGKHQSSVANVQWHLLVVVALGTVSAVRTVWGFGKHSPAESFQLGKR